MGEGSAEEGESWKRGLRARVTALKCHVMATQGLTPQGFVVPAYSPDVLMQQPQNAIILQQHNKPKEVAAYVAAAMQSNGSHSETVTTDSLHPGQVHLEMLTGKEQPTVPSELQSTREHVNLVNNKDSTFPGYSPSKCIKKSVINDVESVLDKVDNVVLNKNSLLNNNSDENRRQWQWQTTFDSDNDDDDSPEANGYIRVSAEGDEFDVALADLPAESPNVFNATKCNKLPASPSSSNHVMDSSTIKSKSSCGSSNSVYVCAKSSSKEKCSCCKAKCGEVQQLQADLQQQHEEVQRLSNIRDEVENELQELTANLFQEAHKMVTAANQRTACAEKSLREAKMAVDVLSGEVTALKAMVITSTPAAPNHHLHPQLHSSGSKLGAVSSSPSLLLTGGGDGGRQDVVLASTATSSLPSASSASLSASSGLRIFQRGHKKSPSDFDLKYGRDTTPPSSPLKGAVIKGGQPATEPIVLDPGCWEVDPVCHREFVSWHQNCDASVSLSPSQPFLRHIYEEDMSVCLSFPNTALSHALERAVHDNDLFIEEVNMRHQRGAPTTHPDETRKCVLLEVARFCKYRFRLGSKQPYTWYYISQLARNRIIAVCDFLNYLRYIKQGLVKSSIHDMYWEIVKLRRQMALARLGF